MTTLLSRLLAVTVLLGFALALAVSAGGAQGMTQATGPDLAAIDAYIEEEMARARIPGLALAVVRGSSSCPCACCSSSSPTLPGRCC